MQVNKRNHKRGAIAAAVAAVSGILLSISGNPVPMIFGVFGCPVAYWYFSRPTEKEIIAACLSLAREVAPKFRMSKYMFGLQRKSGILLDERGKMLMLFEEGGARHGVYPDAAILSFETIEDGETVSSTSTGIGSAALGGLALGGVGLVAGALMGKKEVRTKTELSEVLLKVMVNDRANPIHRVTLFNSPKPVDRKTPEVKSALRVAEDANALLGMLIKQAAV